MTIFEKLCAVITSISFLLNLGYIIYNEISFKDVNTIDYVVNICRGKIVHDKMSKLGTIGEWAIPVVISCLFEACVEYFKAQ